VSFSRGKSADTSENFAVCSWIQAFLTDKPLSDYRKVAQWQEWAIGRLAAGWDAEQVRQRIRDAWAAWVLGGNVDVEQMPEDLKKAIAEVYQMAHEGMKPAQCAVVYRSLYNQNPDRPWLLNAARDWEAMGESWREGS